VTWPTTSGRPRSFRVTRRKQKGQLPLADSPGLGHERAPARQPGRPIRVRDRGTGQSMRCGATWEKVEKKEEVRLMSRSHPSVK
jgi:hypothetical protein